MNNDNATFQHVDGPNREPLRYRGCGLDNVYLRSGYELVETPYGNGISIKDVDDLHKAIGMHLVETRKDLDGKEVRFLRHQMDLTQAELGNLLGCSDQTIARFEKNKTPIKGPSDRLLRLLFEEHVRDHGCVRDFLEGFNQQDGADGSQMTFMVSDQGWRAAA